MSTRRLRVAQSRRDRVTAPLAFTLKPAELPQPLESDILPGIVKYMRMNRAVAWVARINSGGAENAQGQYVAFHDIRGCSDIIGQMRTGQFLAIEVKRPGQRPTPKQQAFLELVAAFGGCSGWCTSAEGAARIVSDWVRRA